MKLSRPVAWLLLLSTVFTAGLLRQFHSETLVSPYVPTAVGSLLFALVFILLLVTAREHRAPAVGGSGVRLGSLTPLMLVMLGEKWISLSIYPPLFHWLAPSGQSPAALDAQFAAFAGAILLGICLLFIRITRYSGFQTQRVADIGRAPRALIAIFSAVFLANLLLFLLGWVGSANWRWVVPRADSWGFVMTGQATIAFAEEFYYRGLLLYEFMRLAPRLGLREHAGRRWFALSLTALLFGLEHLRLDVPPGEVLQRAGFAVCLGVLFGMLVLITRNLYVPALLHIWINWLLLGAAPRLIGPNGGPPPGAYIGLALALSFVAVYVLIGNRIRRGSPGGVGAHPTEQRT